MDTTALKQVKRIICHSHCPDGIASAMILRHALPDAQIEMVQYSTEHHKQLKATEGMLFCDIVPHQDNVQPFVDAGAIVLDHHDGAQDIVAAFGERGVFASKPGRSGAVLAYEEAWIPMVADPNLALVLPSRQGVKEFARLAGIRDTWQTKHKDWPEACAQAAALLFYPIEYWLGTDPDRCHRRPYLEETERNVGRILFNKRIQLARKIAEGGLFLVYCNKLDIMFGFFNDSATDKLTSDVAEEARKLPRLPYEGAIDVVCGYYATRVEVDKLVRQQYVYSLRSGVGDKDIDVAELCKRLGGGGHKRAAGCRLTIGATDKNPAWHLIGAIQET